MSAPDATVGDRLRRRRRALGLSQKELARRAGVGTTLVTGLECHDQVATSAAHLYGLARALGVSMEELMGLPALPSSRKPDVVIRMRVWLGDGAAKAVDPERVAAEVARAVAGNGRAEVKIVRGKGVREAG